MKTLTSVLFIAFLYFPTVILGDTETDIKKYCEGKWTTDYQMRNYCVDKMREGLGKLSSKVKQYGKEGEQYKIINRCWSKWYPQLDMINYCANKQITAYDRAKSENQQTGSSDKGGTEDEIKTFCTEKWSSNYEMLNYCVDKINEGWRKVSKMVEQYGKAGEEYRIINRCRNKWYPQLDMVEYCSTNQLRAYKSQ